MDLPSKVNILGKTYTIKYCDRPTDVSHDGRSALFGEIDYWTRSIKVYAKNRTTEDMFHTIVHEIIHGILSDMHQFGANKNEAMIDILASGLADTFIRNGWLELEVVAHKSCLTQGELVGTPSWVVPVEEFAWANLKEGNKVLAFGQQVKDIEERPSNISVRKVSVDKKVCGNCEHSGRFMDRFDARCGKHMRVFIDWDSVCNDWEEREDILIK